MIFVKKDRGGSDDDSCTKQIPFRSLLKVSLPDEREEKSIQANDAQKPWLYAFFVATTDRIYTLYACSEQHRACWDSALRYILQEKTDGLN